MISINTYANHITAKIFISLPRGKLVLDESLMSDLMEKLYTRDKNLYCILGENYCNIHRENS
jgi:hypothetical protein